MVVKESIRVFQELSLLVCSVVSDPVLVAMSHSGTYSLHDPGR